MDKTILVVDDHPLYRKALVNLVEERADTRALAASTAEEGLQKLAQSEVDLILLDLGLPGAAGVDALTMLKRASAATIMVVSASEHRPEITSAIRAGAAAVVSKGVSMDALRDLVEQALGNQLPDQRWIRPTGTLAVAGEVSKGLTTRQQEIATLLMDGHSNKEIGMRLGLAEITVKSHLTAIFRLLGVVNRTQAVVAIRRLGVDYSSRIAPPTQ
jgi:DNA-binding NarL/FixJ family response regulator